MLHYGDARPGSRTARRKSSGFTPGSNRERLDGVTILFSSGRSCVGDCCRCLRRWALSPAFSSQSLDYPQPKATCRRLLRHEGRGPVPVDGGSQRARGGAMGGRAERRHLQVPRHAADARRAEDADHRALELPQRVTAPYYEGGRWFYSRNTGLQRQAVVFTRETLTAAGNGRRSIRTRCRPTDRSRCLISCRRLTARTSPTGCPKVDRTGRPVTCASSAAASSCPTRSAG